MHLVSESDSGLTQSFPVSIASPSGYVALLKPRVMSLVLFTALTGVLIAPLHVNPVIGFASLLAIAAGAGASGALNMWYDADMDALMRRPGNDQFHPAECLKRMRWALAWSLPFFRS
jgi:protoheme IX farnesyltransferase